MWARAMVKAGYIEPPTATTGSRPSVEATANRALASMSKTPIATRAGSTAPAPEKLGRIATTAAAIATIPPALVKTTAQPGRSAEAASRPVKKIPKPTAAPIASRIDRRATGRCRGSSS
jgi:hypothetical protein